MKRFVFGIDKMPVLNKMQKATFKGRFFVGGKIKSLWFDEYTTLECKACALMIYTFGDDIPPIRGG
ncbi:MAG: hypothetical protein IJV96_00370 [Clostridia bacterium]|nr:hypothetical protein [Clostridia bacterium]